MSAYEWGEVHLCQSWAFRRVCTDHNVECRATLQYRSGDVAAEDARRV
jgi:hypothetical protein